LEPNCCLFGIVANYSSALHHEFYPLKFRDVLQRVAGNGNYVFFYGAEYVRVAVINADSTVFFVRSMICASVGIRAVSVAPAAIIFSSLMRMT